MDPSDLNSAELQSMLEGEKQKAMVHEMVSKLTSQCWDKCITGAPGNKFSSSETTCLSNCAQRFLDLSNQILTKFQAR